MCDLNEAFGINLNSRRTPIEELEDIEGCHPYEYKPDDINFETIIEQFTNPDKNHSKISMYDCREYPKENIEYNPNDIFEQINNNKIVNENMDDIIQCITQELDSKPICEYSRNILKKYKILDTRLKPIEYYYDSTTDIFYFSYVDREPHVRIVQWSNYRRQYIPDMKLLVEDEKEIISKLMPFSNDKQIDLVRTKLEQFLKI